MGGFRMQKGNLLATGTFNRSLMDKTAATLTRLFDLAFNVICLVGHMMNAFAVFFKEFGNGAFIRSRLQQFNMNFTYSKKSCLNFLRLYRFLTLARQAKNFLIEDPGLVNGPYCNS